MYEYVHTRVFTNYDKHFETFIIIIIFFFIQEHDNNIIKTYRYNDTNVQHSLHLMHFIASPFCIT